MAIVCGPRLIDASEARSPDDILALARSVVCDHDGPAAVVIWR